MRAQQQTNFGQKTSQMPQNRRHYSRAVPYQTAATAQVSAVPTYNNVLGPGYSKSYNDGLYAKPVKGLRFLSGFIDGTIFMVVLIGYILITDPNPTVAGGDQSDRIFSALIWLSLVWLMVSAVMESSSLQGTPGKILTGTKITDQNGDRISIARSFARNAAKILSSIVPFYLSYTMVFWTQKFQSLHDLIAGTFVYRKSDVATTGNVFD